MKLPPILYLLSLILGGSLPVHSEESQPATAHVLGDLSDGTVAPVPAEAKFIVPATDILETKTIPQGGRTITIQRIKPIALPESRKAAAPLDIQQPAIQQRISEVEAVHRGEELLFVSASVFRANDGSTRTLATLQPSGNGGPVTFWSSAHFGYLSGFNSFIGSGGEARSLIMAWSAEEIATVADLVERRAPEAGLPALPELRAGQAAFALVTPNPAAETLAAVQSLHDLYNNEHDRLKAAYQGREQARLTREAELLAHPPRPKNITLSYWRTENPAPAAAKGGAR